MNGGGAARRVEGGQEVRGGGLGGAEALRAGALRSLPGSVPPRSQPGPGPLVAQTDQDDGVDYEEPRAGHQAHQDHVGQRQVGGLAGLLTAGHHHGLLAARPHLLDTNDRDVRRDQAELTLSFREIC